MRDLSAFLTKNVVLPLNEAGVPIDLRGVQLGLLLLPVLFVLAGFARAWWRKRRELKRAGM